jgi:hypothetical protein
VAVCAHVTVTPDANRIAVFSRGICRGLNGKIPVGGHVEPNSIVGDKLRICLLGNFIVSAILKHVQLSIKSHAPVIIKSLNQRNEHWSDPF